MTGARVATRLALALLAACGGGRDDAHDSPPPGGAGAASPAASTARLGNTADAGAPPAPGRGGRRPCSYTGRWDPCTITERLDRAGLAPQPISDTPTHPVLGTPAAAWRLGNAHLLVFIYPDEGARVDAQKKLNPGQFLTPDEEVGMNALPTLIANENLLAVLDSRSEHQRERVADAITAGPPQASP